MVYYTNQNPSINVYQIPRNFIEVPSSNVLLVKIEGPVWYTIYHHLRVKGLVSNPSNQPMREGHLWSYIPPTR